MRLECGCNGPEKAETLEGGQSQARINPPTMQEALWYDDKAHVLMDAADVEPMQPQGLIR